MGKSSYKDRARSMGEKRKEKSNITLKEGSNCLRVHNTPASKTTPEVVMEYQVHRDVGPNKWFGRCGHEVVEEGEEDKGKCWLCDKKTPELIKQKKSSRAEKLAPQVVTAVQASVVTEDDDGHITFGKPKLWNPSGKTGASLLTQILASKKRDYVDPKKGYNINIERTGTSFKETRYGSIEPDDEPTKVPSNILKLVVSFDKLKGIPVYNEDAQKAAYAGKEYRPDEASSDSESASESESASAETETGVDDVFEDETESSGAVKKKDKKKKKESEEESESTSESEDASEEEEVTESTETPSEEESESEEEKLLKGKKKKKR